MTPTKAAKEINCSPQYLRDLIRAGKMKARKVMYVDEVSFYYWITPAEVQRVKNLPSRSTRGRKRSA